jgi:hypothetical protein
MLRTKDVTIESDKPDNRDVGKTFRITEMAAEPAEWWSVRVLQGIAASGVNIPAEVISAGSLGIDALQKLSSESKVKMAKSLLVGLAGIERLLLKDLLDEMFACVQFISSDGTVRKLMPNDIEEVSTRVTIRSKWLEQQFGFSLAAKT